MKRIQAFKTLKAGATPARFNRLEAESQEKDRIFSLLYVKWQPFYKFFLIYTLWVVSYPH